MGVELRKVRVSTDQGRGVVSIPVAMDLFGLSRGEVDAVMGGEMVRVSGEGWFVEAVAC